ncbi:MAG: cbb3-type cytochrome oxidase assembly protein CcoS [Thalassolituus sp.]|jgi:cbb3-type cytochrome oxidase maturation protein|nr:cbb3-type cytochrome oxidase assembly protein CcoS [Thalassolituus sp.]
MDIIYVLVPLSIALLAIAVAIFFWAVKGGQFDDLDSPAHKILFDDDEYLNERREDSTGETADSKSDSESRNDSDSKPDKTTND